MWALTCEPPLNMSVEEREGYVDEADEAHADPIQFLQKNFPTPPRGDGVGLKRMMEETRYRWPERLVVFGVLEREVLRGYLGLDNEEGGYRVCGRFWNGHWHDDWRRRGDVVVLCLDK